MAEVKGFASGLSAAHSELRGKASPGLIPTLALGQAFATVRAMKKTVILILTVGLALVFLAAGAGAWWMGRVSEREIRDVETAVAARLWSADLCLPSDAKRISAYEKAGGFQDLERFYTFEVSPDRVETVVREIWALNEAALKRTAASAQKGPDKAPASLPAHVPDWWRPMQPESLFYQGSTAAFALQIWADRQSGRVHVFQND